MNTLSDVYKIHLYYYNCIHPTTWCISLLQIALNDSFPKQVTQVHVYFFLSEIPASPVFIPKCRTDNSVFSRSTRRPSQYLDGEKYSYLTVILHKLSEHLSEQTSVTHPAWREQQIKRRLCSRRCELDSSLAEQIRLTHRGARIIALTTVLRQDRLEKEKGKKESRCQKKTLLKK